jgi:hypothetical protein
MPWANGIWRQQLQLEERGYIIPAFNTGTIDYVDCARTLAKTLLAQHPDARICLLTNDQYATEPHLFAHTKIVDTIDTDNPFANDPLVFTNSPFRQTIKLEADMMAAGPVDHWWTLFEHRDVVISQGCRDFYGNVSTCRTYRKLFDSNNLPDVYNAITYWRASRTATDFFKLVKKIFSNWQDYKTLLKFPEEVPSTDVVYAMAAQIMGPELVTLPQGFGPQIVHMKKGVNPFTAQKWTDELVWEMNPMRINTVAQWGFFHYNVKDWHNE